MMNVKLDEKQTGKNIKSYRKQRGWTKAELADRAMVSVDMVDFYEKARGPFLLFRIDKFANALNVHPNWLMSWKQEAEE